MRSLFALAPLIAVLFAKPATKPAPKPLAPLPMLPSVGKVKLVLHGGALVVVEDVTLPRGEWNDEPLDFHVAFGAPGPPRAIDAHLVPIGDGSLEADDDERGEAVPFDRVPRRPPSAHPLLGRDTMAGIVVHLRRESLASALEPGKMAALRIRTALDVPDLDPQGARGVVVRLGASADGTPLTLGRIVVASRVARAEARLCGPDADPRLLAVAPRTPGVIGAERPIAPIVAVRHASDDLCVRFWP